MFLSGNDRKTAAMKKLAVLKCRLGYEDRCYARTDSCDALVAFYADQDRSIDSLRHVSEAMIRDFESISQTNLELAEAKGVW